jgi:Mrp family chromosome partitioning ATPase
VTTATQSQLGRLLENAQKAKMDFIIIDTAPHSDSDAAMAAQLADFVLIPSRPMFFDLHAILSTYDIARLSKTPAAVVLNGVPPRGSLSYITAPPTSTPCLTGAACRNMNPKGRQRQRLMRCTSLCPAPLR